MIPLAAGGPIRATDFLDRDAYAPIRARVRRHIIDRKRRRRVELGPHVAICFEDRETVLHQIQEILFVEGIRAEHAIQREIDEYAPLLPAPGRVTATLLVSGGVLAGPFLRGLTDGRASLSIEQGRTSIAAILLDRAPDDCPVRYLAFGPLPRSNRAAPHLRARCAPLDDLVSPVPAEVAREVTGDARSP